MQFNGSGLVLVIIWLLMQSAIGYNLMRFMVISELR
jgi:hypothetical protein